MSIRLLFVVFLGVILLQYIDCSKENALEVVYEWKYIDYDFGSEEEREAAIKSGDYNYTNAVPIDVDRWRGLTFVTVIRDKGVPSSLNIVTNKKGPGGPLLRPYPDWSWAKLGDCSSITSAYRVAIDKCGKLWVLDNGKVGSDTVCGPQILVFDLQTTTLVKRVKIPQNIATNSTTGQGLLVTPLLLQGRRQCRHISVLIADVEGHALILYNGIDHSLTRIISSAFDFEPKATTYTINGESFSLQDGVVGLARSSETGRIYFSPMSSYNFDVLNSFNYPQYYKSDVVLQYTDFLCTQSSAKAMAGEILFFGLVHDTSIGCWNEYSELSSNSTDVVAQNSETLQFTSGLKTADNELWALTNRFQKVSAGTLNYNEVNFRILKRDVDTLVQNTRCQRRPEKTRFSHWFHRVPALPSPSSLKGQLCAPAGA